jgi:hypothetical protein
MYVHSTLSWKIHIEQITCKVSGNNYSMRLVLYVTGNTEYNLLCLFSLYYELWIDILG